MDEDCDKVSPNISLPQQKLVELTEAARKLREEAARLKVNMDRMHEVQADLYQTDLKLLQYVEDGHKLKYAQLSLDKLISCIQKGKDSC